MTTALRSYCLYTSDTLHTLHNSAIPWGLSDSEAYVYAFSNKSTDRYTNNTPTDFYNHLAKPMNLSRKWMVALCELRYQKSWVQLYRSQEVDVDLECVKYCAPKKISVKFRRGNYFTPHDFNSHVEFNMGYFSKEETRCCSLPTHTTTATTNFDV